MEGPKDIKKRKLNNHDIHNQNQGINDKRNQS